MPKYPFGKVVTDEEREQRQARKDRQTASLFAQGMSQAAEPGFVFSTLKKCALERAALKSQPLDAEELEWLRDVLQEGEEALAAVRALIETGDTTARRVQALKIKNKM